MKYLLKARLYAERNLLKDETDQVLALSSLFSTLLVFARILYTGHYTFLFMIWNLFLAFIPYVLTSQLVQRPAWVENKRKLAVVFIIWLLFVPNAFYILTDLFHLYRSPVVPQWFDLALLLSFAWNGLMLGVLSVRQMEKVILPLFRGKYSWLFIYGVMGLNAFGVYIGRYLRFNSWDILANPFHLVVDIGRLVFHPLQYKHAWGMVLCYSILMTLIYLMLKRLGKVI